MTTLMKLTSFAKAAAMAILGIMLTAGCQKPDNGPTTEEPRTNFFVYDGYSFDIRSAVQYDKGDNSVEVWLSPVSGLTTSKEIEAGGDYVVFNTHKSFLGSRDRFNSQSSKESYICFGEQKFAYGKEGTAYIEADIRNDSLIVSFLAEKLYTKADVKPLGILTGEYKGPLTIEKEKPYENEWGFDREHHKLASALMTMREDDGDWSLAFMDESGKEAIKIELPSDKMEKPIIFTADSKPSYLTVRYDGGNKLSLDGASGQISITNDEKHAMIFSLTINAQGRILRAEYKGGFKAEIKKLNRFKYTYDGDSPYEGTQTIVKLMVEDKGGVLKLFFSPSEGYSISNANSTHMPILTIPSSIINKGTKSFRTDIKEDWEFAYDMMQVWPYTDEYRPHADYNDWVKINREGKEYEVELMLTSLGEGMQTSWMDLYYKGEATN